jgi:DNA polymerase-3 subunit epsilon
VNGSTPASHPTSVADDFAAQRFAVVDTETTGLSTTDDVVLQIGVVVVCADGTVEHEYSTYLRRLTWGFGHVGAYSVHGITRRKLRSGVTPPEALTQLNELLRGALFTAHNAKFDLGFLASDAARFGIDMRLSLALCTLQMSRKLDPKRERSHKLGDVAQRYGIARVQEHDALADARLTARCLPHLLRDLSIASAATLRSHLIDAV